MKGKAVLSASVVPLALAGCGGSSYSSSYPPGFADQVMLSCTTTGASGSQCSCALNWIEANHTYADMLGAQGDGDIESIAEEAVSNCGGS